MEKRPKPDLIRSAYLTNEEFVPDSTWDYLDQLQDRLDTPNMANEWGCITAAGAFVHNLLCNSNVTPAQLDKVIGRTSDQPGDNNLVDMWHLDNGLNVQVYISETLRNRYHPYLRGEIGYDEYFAQYQKDRGPVHSAADRKLHRDYSENVRKPAYARLQARLQPYRESGRYTEPNREPSPELLIELVNQGKLVYFEKRVSETSSHALVAFRPRMDLPAFYFYPNLPRANDPSQGSFIGMLMDDTVNNMICDGAFRAISR